MRSQLQQQSGEAPCGKALLALQLLWRLEAFRPEPKHVIVHLLNDLTAFSNNTESQT